MTPKVRLQVDAPNDSSSQGTATVRSRNIEFQVEQAVARATNWLLSAQTQDGYWWAELEADTTLESDYILYLHILGQLDLKKPRSSRSISVANNCLMVGGAFLKAGRLS